MTNPALNSTSKNILQGHHWHDVHGLAFRYVLLHGHSRKQKGATKQVADRYLNAFMDGSIPVKINSLLDALERAVTDFNAIRIKHRQYPKVGIVGEIYVKYNEFSNNYVAQC